MAIYKCDHCGRNRFTRKVPHQCVGGYRKRGLQFTLLTKHGDDKYDVATQFRAGFAAKVLCSGSKDWDKETPHFLAGYAAASKIIHEEQNAYLRSLGIEGMAVIHLAEPTP